MKSHQKDGVLAAAASMQGMLSVAAGLAGAGRALDLTGLDKEMTALCSAAMLLPADQGRAVRPALIGLLSQIDSLTEQLRTA
ncbi:hypothetical protein [Muricoccus radiodurans]|uniref:hypothetical protein n=1 Tax=Muricoccus radiodurans TaxID=2231721 RepID=UPI003CEC6E81